MLKKYESFELIMRRACKDLTHQDLPKDLIPHLFILTYMRDVNFRNGFDVVLRCTKYVREQGNNVIWDDRLFEELFGESKK